jgi:hypothetical protein
MGGCELCFQINLNLYYAQVSTSLTSKVFNYAAQLGSGAVNTGTLLLPACAYNIIKPILSVQDNTVTDSATTSSTDVSIICDLVDAHIGVKYNPREAANFKVIARVKNDQLVSLVNTLNASVKAAFCPKARRDRASMQVSITELKDMAGKPPCPPTDFITSFRIQTTDDEEHKASLLAGAKKEVKNVNILKPCGKLFFVDVSKPPGVGEEYDAAKHSCTHEQKKIHGLVNERGLNLEYVATMAHDMAGNYRSGGEGWAVSYPKKLGSQDLGNSDYNRANQVPGAPEVEMDHYLVGGNHRLQSTKELLTTSDSTLVGKLQVKQFPKL